MLNPNMIIANNIRHCLNTAHKTQSDLAKNLNISQQTVRKILSGERTIKAPELRQIAAFCKIPISHLTVIPTFVPDTEPNVLHSFIDQVKTEAARRAIQVADELIDLFIFHETARQNGLSQATQKSSLV